MEDERTICRQKGKVNLLLKKFGIVEWWSSVVRGIENCFDCVWPGTLDKNGREIRAILNSLEEDTCIQGPLIAKEVGNLVSAGFRLATIHTINALLFTTIGLQSNPL